MTVETVEVLAKLMGIQIECREICDKWLLVTYDIPHNKTGDAARRAFLVTARTIGATRHTDSVYLMPYTSSAEALALEVAKKGDVCIWTSNTTDQSKAAEITKSYDAGLQPILDEIDARIDKISKHLRDKHYKRADKMRVKTEKMLASVKNAIIRRGSAQLFILVTLLEKRFVSL